MQYIQDYIESGLLEQYALGELDPPARAAVEAQAAQHPEIGEELARIQANLEAYADLHAVTPPPAMRERVLAHVLAHIKQNDRQATTTPVASSSLRADVDAVAGRLNGHPSSIAPLRDAAVNPAAGRSVRSLWAMAASVALLASLVGNVLLYNNWQDANQHSLALENQQARYAATTQAVQRDLAGAMEENLVLRDDNYKAVALAGTKQAPSARARVLFNPASRKVYVDVERLPSLPAGQQYQLWALDQGKPVDAGVLAAATVAGDSLQQMKNIASAQAFAMTIEPTGGSVSPTLSTMTVMGAI